MLAGLDEKAQLKQVRLQPLLGAIVGDVRIITRPRSVIHVRMPELYDLRGVGILVELY